MDRPGQPSSSNAYSIYGTMRRGNAPHRLNISSPRSLRPSVPDFTTPPRRAPEPPLTAPFQGPPSLPPQRELPPLPQPPRPPQSEADTEATTSRCEDQQQESMVIPKSSYESFSKFRHRSGSGETVRGAAPRDDDGDDAHEDDDEGAADDEDEDDDDDGFGDVTSVNEITDQAARVTQPSRSYWSPLTSNVPSRDGSDTDPDRLWLLSSVMNEAVLALQGTVSLATFSAITSVTVWEKTSSDPEFWSWIWSIAQPLLAVETITMFGTLMLFEARGGFSTVTMLYMESAALTLTTALTLAVEMRSFDQESRGVKGVVVGCGMMMWAIALLAFIRAVVVWRVHARNG